jgi:hypothetical protein
MIAARFTAVVVFPTPPFWFATAIALAILMSLFGFEEWLNLPQAGFDS